MHKSTISHELNRNMTFVRTALGSWQCKPDYAQSHTEERHKHKPKKIKLTPDVGMFIHKKLLEDWSPDQISGYPKRHNLFSLSHERIHQVILADKQQSGELYKHLHHQQKKYHKRYGRPKRQGPIKNRFFIDDTPSIVNEKQRIGDWEIDTITGKNHKQGIVSIVERASKKAMLGKVKSKTEALVSALTISSLKSIEDKVLTITADNGSEFAYHEKNAHELKADIYSAHPHSSWERSLNDNTNGLARQYFKKGSDFSHIKDIDLSIIVDKLNNRPRKALGYATPEEVFLAHT